MTDKHGLPEPPITLSGFPTCAHPSQDGREVEALGDFCVQDGGKPASIEILRRAVHRQIRSAIIQMKKCHGCEVLELTDIRCSACTWCRGAAMGIAGIAGQLGWADEIKPLMAMIGIYAPGWQKKAFV